MQYNAQANLFQILSTVFNQPLPHLPFHPLGLNRLAKGVGRGELLLFHLLPGVQLLVRPQQDVLVTQLIHSHPSLGPTRIFLDIACLCHLGRCNDTHYRAKLPDDRVDASDLVCHLPGCLEAPAVVVAEEGSIVPVATQIRL